MQGNLSVTSGVALHLGTSENVAHLVDDKYLDADGLHDPERCLFHLGDVSPRPLRRTE